METSIVKNEKVHSVWNLLKYTYGLVPIIAGLDKYTNVLVRWEDYLSPVVLQMVPVSGETFMHFVGIVEMVAGVIVLVNPRFGGYLVMVWLLGIAANLLSTGRYYDIAVRDLTMAIGAYCLARLTEATHQEDPLLKRDRPIRQREPSESMQPTESVRSRESLGHLETAL